MKTLRQDVSKIEAWKSNRKHEIEISAGENILSQSERIWDSSIRAETAYSIRRQVLQISEKNRSALIE